MIKNRDELKTLYEGLSEDAEGYIQMSDRKLEYVSQKPSWDEIHNGKNFIFEAAFFDGMRSVTIRQFNDRFIIIDENVDRYKNITENQFITKDGQKAKMIQVWEEREDDNCEGFVVLRPTLQLFAGFEKGESK